MALTRRWPMQTLASMPDDEDAPIISIGDIPMERNPSLGHTPEDDLLDQAIGSTRAEVLGPITAERARAALGVDEDAPIAPTPERPALASPPPSSPPRAGAFRGLSPSPSFSSPVGLRGSNQMPTMTAPSPMFDDPEPPAGTYAPDGDGDADDAPIAPSGTPQSGAMGLSRPAPSPMPAVARDPQDTPIDASAPNARMRAKNAGDPFHASLKEQLRLDQARGQDARSHRRGAILRAIGTIVGIAGLGSGMGGLAAVGAGLTSGGAALRGRNRAQDEQARIDERMRGDQAQLTYDTEQEQRAAAGARQAAQDALAGRRAEADIALTQARSRAADADAQLSDLDAAEQRNDAAAQRSIIRATINGLNDNSGLVREWRAVVNSPEFDQASGDTLREWGARIAQLANNRRAGLLSGGGGRGAATYRIDPTTGEVTYTPASGGGNASQPSATVAAAPTGDAGFDDNLAPPPAAPARRAVPRAPAGAAAAAPAPGGEGSPTSDPRFAAIAQAFPSLTTPQRLIVLRSAIQHGYSSEQLRDPTAQRVLLAAVEQFNAAGDAGRERQLAAAESALAQDRDPTMLRVDRTDYNRAAPRMLAVIEEGVAPFANASYYVRQAIQHGVPEADLRVVLSGAPAARSIAAARGLTGLLQAVQNVRESYGRARSGAAISPSEWENFATILGSPSVFSSSGDFVEAMQRLQQQGMSLVAARAAAYGGASGGDAIYGEFMRQQRLARAAARRRRSEGGR